MDHIKRQTKILRVYFNNHYGGTAVVNALQFEAMTGHSLSEIETKIHMLYTFLTSMMPQRVNKSLEHAQKYLSTHGLLTSSSVYPS